MPSQRQRTFLENITLTREKAINTKKKRSKINILSFVKLPKSELVEEIDKISKITNKKNMLYLLDRGRSLENVLFSQFNNAKLEVKTLL